MIKLTVLVVIFMLMEQNTLDLGLTINNMEKAKKYGLMVVAMLETM